MRQCGEVVGVYDRSRQGHVPAFRFMSTSSLFFVSWLVAAAPSKETSEVGSSQRKSCQSYQFHG